MRINLNYQKVKNEKQFLFVPPTLNYKPTPGGHEFKWNTRVQGLI